MSVETLRLASDIAARRRASVMAALIILVVLLALTSLGIGPVRLSPLTVIDALFGGGTRCAANHRAGNPAAAHRSRAGDRRHPRAVRRGAAGPAAQSAGIALAVRRAAIRRLRRGAGDLARACRCAILGAAGRGDCDGVRLGIRAAEHRGPQRRTADSHSGGARDLEPCGRHDGAGDEPVEQSVRGARNRILAARLAGGSQFPARPAGAAVHRRGRDHPDEPAQRFSRAHARRGDGAEPRRRCRPAAACR